jgi:catechol 2,3-dioxygenase-like lactoylglutathione lyase family enzyme
MEKATSLVELDHISVNVRDLKRARKFYERALGAIGMKINMDVSSAFGMGSKNEKIFWLARDRHAKGHGHYALRVPRREDVKAFYDAAIAAGGTDNGKPGTRPDYGARYYAAFVKDAEDNNIEVVCYAKAAPNGRSASSRARRTTTAPRTKTPRKRR